MQTDTEVQEPEVGGCRASETIPSKGQTRFTVYGLIAPDSPRVRYVGQTSKMLFQRLKNHVSFARYADGEAASVVKWVRYLLDHGQFPQIVPLANDIGSEEEALAVEKALIGVYAGRYHDLLNANCLPKEPPAPLSYPEVSNTMKLLRAIPSQKRAAASRANGKRGGRPRKSK